MQDFTSQAYCVTVNYSVWHCMKTNSFKVTIRQKVLTSMMEEKMDDNYLKCLVASFYICNHSVIFLLCHKVFNAHPQI